ncbi:MAG: hypothetical protein RLY91_563, partial [Pseudomonadota bacterium]
AYGGAVWTLVQVHTNGACYLVSGSFVCSAQLTNSIFELIFHSINLTRCLSVIQKGSFSVAIIHPELQQDQLRDEDLFAALSSHGGVS